jgi:hypothetical protein
VPTRLATAERVGYERPSMRPETVSMAIRFLDAAFGGNVGQQTLSDGDLVVNVQHLGVTHAVAIAPELLNRAPTAIMAALREVPTLLKREKTPTRIIVAESGISTERF